MGIPFGNIDIFSFADGFGNGFSFGSDVGGLLGVFGTVGALLTLLMLLFAIMAFSIVAYILQSKALFSIAKRRGIKNPWLAWLPVGTDWIIGSISDQYQYVTRGNIRNLRKLLLGFGIATTAMSNVKISVDNLPEIKNTLFSATTGVVDIVFGVLIVVFLFLAIALLCATVVYAVYSYIALYDIFRSCDPSKSRRNLLLSIFLGVVTPFLLHACCKKDLGMPPRKDEVRQALPENVACEDAPAAPTEPTEE